ncbi:hypothetical protein ATI61_102547 [Archangium gephyra]|uniref:Transmembrane protein n=1 Tax=Archangium gephyra TaxID=48 RepID=A0AAC8TGU7_9BACT|nr:DUF6766 family protein [Archangium gephyra]AKJ05488.1 Hypothetical protein AA314_07114 [Archangium gephyra]REG36170.1 hypothetical protein ATI61_102547 [Archangium gephyra]
MRRFLRNNGLSVVMFGLFLLCWIGQSLTGWSHYNHDQEEHGQSTVTWSQYVTSGEFIEATFENWESEFFQMGCFVLFTVFLRQKGSGESKSFEPEEVDKDPRAERKPDSPGPVHRGGLALRLYSHSLTIALFGLFAFCFLMHALGGVAEYNEEARAHGQPTLGLLGFMASSSFWFQSFQNWQSEFLSVAVLVVLSIFLREKGSPESKPVHASHEETGR